jgi:hypothetical protein
MMVGLLATSVAADEVILIEDFEDLQNESGWVVNSAQDFLDPAGGHPGAFLHTPVVSFAPSPRTTAGLSSIFTGNFRERRVVSVGVDLKTFSNTAPIVIEWPLSVMLVGDSGTPDNDSDDCYALYLGSEPVPPEEVPCVTAGIDCTGWRDYSFDIPSQSTTLPEGWIIPDFNGCSNDDATWNEIITSVGQINYHYGDPQFPAPDINWNIGVDNALIVENPPGTEAIPAMSEWGVLALALMMLTFGSLAFRRADFAN